MKTQPILLLGICFILGILFQEYFPVPENGGYILLIISFLTIFFLFNKSIFLLRFRNFFLGFFFFSIGVFLHQFYNQNTAEINLAKNETIVFQLSKKLNSTETNKKYEVVAWKEFEKQKFKSILIIPNENEELNFKHFYKAEVFINKVEKPLNDYQFDYQKYLRRKGIFHQIYVPNGFKKSVEKELNFIEKYRQKRLDILKKTDETNLSKTSKDLMKGIVLADRTEMDQSVISDFQKSGLVHILAISGAHIAIIFGIFFFIFKLFLNGKQRKLAIILSLIFIWLFGFFIGLGNSVFRACIMITTYFIYVILERKTDLLHALSLAALMILFLDTNQFFDVGFQLSFSAVLGIFWLHRPFKNALPKSKNTSVNFLYDIFCVTMAAQIGTLPLVLFYFHQFSFISVFANLLIVPLLQIIIIFSIVMVFVISFDLNFNWLNFVFDHFINGILNSIHWLASFDGLFSDKIPLTLLEAVVLGFVIYFLRFLFKGFKAKILFRFGVVAIIFISLRIALNIHYQQKDEIFVHQLFKGKTVSVKEKETVTFYVKENLDLTFFEKYIVNPYLTSRRIKNFEIVKIPIAKKAIEIDGKKYELD